jgi:hemoglobin
MFQCEIDAKEELLMSDSESSLYARLGGYDAIAAVVDDLLERMQNDELLGRFRSIPRSSDTDGRIRQLTLDFIAAAAGGPTIYLGRNMKISHAGMGITKKDYAPLTRNLKATLDEFKISEPERSEVLALIESLEPEIVEKK